MKRLAIWAKIKCFTASVEVMCNSNIMICVELRHQILTVVVWLMIILTH